MPSRYSTRISRLRKFSSLTRLEDRTVPSSTWYLPPSNFIINENVAVTGPRSTAFDPLYVAKNFVLQHADAFGVSEPSLADAIVTDQYTDADTGISHVYLRQRINGLDVINANLNIGIAANGSVISAGGGFVADLEDRLAQQGPLGSIMSTLDAVHLAANYLDVTLDAAPVINNPVYGPVQAFVISSPEMSFEDIPARLHYVPTADGSAALAWQLIVQTTDSQHWYDMSIDAQSGSLLMQSDWMADADYHGVPLPGESPVDGGFSTLTNPADLSASPFGWHDTNGVAGADFTDTQGNNVDAHLDVNADNSPDATPRPDGGAALNFGDFLYDIAREPQTPQSQSAAVVNLFYMNNMIHDIQYKYGFTEVAGNFQFNNYGKGGADGDEVQADAQDGSGTNNANFGTPPDGSSPRMQMFIWNNANPTRDSDLDNGVIIHEYSHGISNRLTGGPANSNALNTTQSGGMGEGWGDFFALMLQQRPTDPQMGSYGIGTYLLGQPITGTGIRRFPYSYNMAINPLMWDAYGDASAGSTPYGVAKTLAVHRTGEIWCSTLWDLNWLLINKYGYDPNLSTGWTATPGPGNAGNKLMMRLVMDGMKLQPANPSVINARDGIIAADIALTGGANLHEIWAAFARRGLGANAATADGNATTISIDTGMPMFVSSTTPAHASVVTTPPLTYTVNVTHPIDPASLQGSDLVVNGMAATAVVYTPGSLQASFTFAINPVTAEGPQTIQIAGSAFSRASDSAGVGAYSSNFYFDSTALLVNSISPAAGSINIVPSLSTVDVNLNGAINPASVQNSDLSITRGTVTGFTLLNGDKTVRFSLSNLVNEGSMYISIAKGAFADVQGNVNAAFAGGSYTLDFSSIPFPTPLTQRNLRGSLVYDGFEHANIGFAGDGDTMTLDLDEGQLLNIVVNADPNLRPSLTITGPGTNITKTATIAGGTANLELVPITVGGTYKLAVTGAGGTTGDYGVYVRLNEGVELESNGGANNNSTGSAQNIDSLFSSVGNGISRAALVGQSDLASAPESEPNDTTGNANAVLQSSAAPTNYFQMMLSGEVGVGSDVQDYFNIGQLQVGDVITVSESGLHSGRGTLNDSFVYLYRAGASTTILASDDDSGPKDPAVGGDSLIHRYTVTTTDTYYIRATRFGSTNVGTYQVGVLLENTSTVPATGGGFVNEGTLANGSIGGAENASASWRSVQYVATTSGAITSGDTDLFKYSLTAGDRVSLVVNSDGTLDPQTALLDPSGTALATDNSTGPYAIPGGFAAVFGYIIPTTGDYYLRVTGAGSSTGSYTADMYASTTPVLPVLPPASDHYSITLAAGQAVTAVIKNLDTGNLDISVLDGGGAVLASGVSGSTNLDEIAANIVAPTAGTYYVRISGPRDIDYQLNVIKGGTFDAEANDSFATAQSLGASGVSLGSINGNDDWYSFTAVAGLTYTISTATPGGGTGEFTNNLDPLVELFNPSNISVGSDNNSAPDSRNAVFTHTALASGNYRVRLTGTGATSGEYVLRVVGAAAPRVSDVIINEGSSQRSRIDSLTVNFNQVVTLPANIADAFLLTRQGGGSVTLNAAASSIPNTSGTLTFTGGSVDFGSLADGRYALTVLAAQVTSGGGQLDGDNNGVGGDNYVLDSATAPSPATNIFRLFGDGNGDGTVNAFDFGQFRGVFGLPGPDSVFDFNDDNVTNATDFSQFRARFGLTI